jgi:hypothetical protein
MQSSMTRAEPVAAARLPRRPAHRASLVVRAAAEGLESWQVSKLKQAYAAGRRQVQVSGVESSVCGGCTLPAACSLQLSCMLPLNVRRWRS